VLVKASRAGLLGVRQPPGTSIADEARPKSRPACRGPGVSRAGGRAQPRLQGSGIHGSSGRPAVAAQLRSSLCGKAESVLAEASPRRCQEGSARGWQLEGDLLQLHYL